MKVPPYTLVRRIGSTRDEPLARHPSHAQRVGLWDVSSQVGRLTDIIAILNDAQSDFAFFELQAAVPAGLISRPERVEEWARELTGRERRKERKDFRNNVIFEQFEERADTIRKGFGIDYLVGIVPSMVASEDEINIYWNSFLFTRRRIMLVSTYELRRYAHKAERSFEVAVASIVISSLLAAINPKLDFHEQTRGCLFDNNKKRPTIVRSLVNLMIEPACLKLMKPKYRAVATAMVEALRTYRRVSAQ